MESTAVEERQISSLRFTVKPVTCFFGRKTLLTWLWWILVEPQHFFVWTFGVVKVLLLFLSYELGKGSGRGYSLSRGGDSFTGQ
jgi:hypothetical protein